MSGGALLSNIGGISEEHARALPPSRLIPYMPGVETVFVLVPDSARMHERTHACMHARARTHTHTRVSASDLISGSLAPIEKGFG